MRDKLGVENHLLRQERRNIQVWGEKKAGRRNLRTEI